MRILKRFKEALKEAKNIVISTHVFPDADGIGSQVALCLALKKMGKNVVCVNEEKLLDRYRYLDTENTIKSAREFLRKRKKEQGIDLFIVVDTNNTARLGPQMVQLSARSKQILYIDHHPCHQAVAALHCIDTTQAATGQLVGELIEGLGIEFSKEMALALYTSILIDTSSFRYPTVTGNTHKLIGKLLETGIRPNAAYNKIYGTKKISHMQLLGEVLSQAQTSANQKIAWISLTKNILERYEADVEDTHAFINHLLILDNVKIACMFRELDHGTKISLRSAGNYDVGEVALALGGGGHNHSSAALIEGPIKEVVPKTIKQLEKILKLYP